MGGCEIIAGDMNGTVTSFQQHDVLWKVNIAEESTKLATLGLVSAYCEKLDFSAINIWNRKVEDLQQSSVCYQLF